MRPLAWVAVVIGCGRLHAEPSLPPKAEPIAIARARPLPSPIQARFSITLRVGERTFPSTGGALILDRPGRGHLAILGPLGGPLAVLQTDGVGVGLAVARDRRHYVAADADHVVRATSRGLVGIDDLLGLFVGDLPLDAAAVTASSVAEDGTASVVLAGADGATLAVALDPATGAPRSVEADDADGQTLLAATYGPFAPLDGGGILVPTELALDWPLFAVHAELRFKSWTVPDPVPEVFGLAPPDGFDSRPMEEVVGGLGAELGALDP